MILATVWISATTTAGTVVVVIVAVCIVGGWLFVHRALAHQKRRDRLLTKAEIKIDSDHKREQADEEDPRRADHET